MRKFLLILFLMVPFLRTAAQTQVYDPGLPALIEIASAQLLPSYKRLETIQISQQAGYIWYKDELGKIRDFQREFNDYLDTFNETIEVAANLYGFTIEVRKTIQHTTNLSKEITASPDNAVAVMLDSRHNRIYNNIYKQMSGILNILREACGWTKMTQAERIELLSQIRPKLKAFNQQLFTLRMLIRTTSILDVWDNITGHQRHLEGRDNVIDESMRRWKTNFRTAASGHKK